MVTNRQLFRIWFGIGIQSFGGGVTTMTLIRRQAVTNLGWLSEEEYNRCWALCQMTPGINLIALTILIGYRVAGIRGSIVSLASLVVPSAALTALLTAAFVSIRSLPAVQATLKGIVPATIGLGLVTSLQMVHKPLADSKREGLSSLGFALFLLCGSGLLLMTGWVSVTLVLVAASVVGAVEGAIRARLQQSESAA